MRDPGSLDEILAAGIDAEDGRIAAERLADFDAERTRGLPADEAARPLGL
jgi:hypothetical protein